MGAKHTPRPWEIVRVHLVPIGIGTRQQHHGAGVHCFRMLGNTLEHGDEEPDLDEVEANARLIAAAPDLLAALKEAEALIAKHAYPCPDKPNSPWGILNRVREAISKADQTAQVVTGNGCQS